MNREELAEINPDAVLLEPPAMDVAIIGIVERCGFEPVVLYSVDKLVQYFVETDGMSDEDALDYVELNIVGAYMGLGTPMFLTSTWTRDVELSANIPISMRFMRGLNLALKVQPADGS